MTPRRVLPGALPALAVASTLLLTAACSTLVDKPGEAQPPAAGRVVTTEAGQLRGSAQAGVLSWRGIPYAAPPVDARRWRAPAPVEPWSGTRDALGFASQCLQGNPEAITPGSAEDCLYLNVFRPAGELDQELPVMVWIHGGGFKAGSGDLPPEMVTGLLAQGVVVVSINYRLGRLGYFAHAALEAEAREAGEEPVANFGLLDQVAALEWVRDNVAKFGGDPDLVTIFGISAGGMSVNDLMVSPLAEGLFDRAIAGSGLGREQPPTYDVAAGQGETLAASLGATDADARELRALDADAVAGLDAFVLRNEVPILDATLPESPSAAFAAGDEAEVPYLVGVTDLEFVDVNFQALGLDPTTVARELVTGHEEEAADAYGTAPELKAHFLNDVVFTEPARLLAQAHAERAPAYLYRFSITNDAVRAKYGGALHGDDFHFVFGHGDPAIDDGDALAEQVAGCWAGFARDGEPGDCAGVAWPTADQGGFVEFTNDGPVTVGKDPWTARLDLVADVYAEAAAQAERTGS